MNRRTMGANALGALAAFSWQVATASPRFHSADFQTAIKRGLSWLLTKQSNDGGWHSDVYGIMKSGVGNTALVVSTFAMAARDGFTTTIGPFRSAIQFLRTSFEQGDAKSAIARNVDFPVLSMCLLLLADQKPMTVDSGLRHRLCRALLSLQRTEKAGWATEHPDFGGWGMLGAGTASSSADDPSTMMATMYAATTLKCAGAMTDEIRNGILAFLGRCQLMNLDDAGRGGFVFTTRADDVLNKAGFRDSIVEMEIANPYLSATCDGLATLFQCDVPLGDARITAAIGWLVNCFHGIENAETETTSREIDGLQFYEAAALSRVCQVVASVALRNRHQSVCRQLIEQQRSDGSWHNHHRQMREDDPLIATCFALQAILAGDALRRDH